MAKLPKRLHEWQEFLDWYAQDNGYWYFPKGRSVQSADLIDSFRVLKSFEGQTWGDAQADYLDSLSSKGLFNRRGEDQNENDATAMARMYKSVFSVLGLAWVEDSEKISITKAGEDFLAANDPISVIEKQVQKYQITNPTLGRAFDDFQVRPHIFLLEVLLNCNLRVSNDEYSLFISRARHHDDIDKVVSWISSWRSLDEGDRTLLKNLVESLHTLGGRRSSLLNTINLNRSYALNFLTFCSYLERPSSGDWSVRLRLSGKYEAESLVRRYRTKGVFIEFSTEKDWFAFYGDPERFPSLEEATDYYVDTSQTDKLEEVTGHGTEYDAQISEKLLEDFLEKNIEQLEKGLKLVGRQYNTITGPIDLLCKDKKGDYVVIELKKGRGSDKVVGQALRYMGFIKTNMLETADQSVRAIIVSRQIDKSLEMAVVGLGIPNIAVKTFSASVKIG